MKKILLLFIALALSVSIFAQMSPVGKSRIANSTTAFNSPLPLSWEVTDASTGLVYQVINPSGVAGTATLTSAAASFKLSSQIQTDWNASTGLGVLLNKPNLILWSDTAFLNKRDADIRSRLKWSDTATMLTNIKNNINLRVKYSDTAAMLTNIKNNINLRVKISDTATMLTNIKNNINLRVKYSDTAAMLTNIKNNINLRVKISDTATMLTNIKNNINLRVKYSDTAAMLSHYIPMSQKGASNGVATLVSGKVPLSQIDDVLLGAVSYQGTYSAATNIPSLPLATGHKGWYYIVSDSGIVNTVTFKNKDWIVSNGTVWDKIDNNNTVDNVFGRRGNIVATSGDYNTDLVTEGSINKYDKTVALSNGTGITVSGTYPNFTITNSAPSSGGTVTSIATGYGITGGTITSIGTLVADSSVLLSKVRASHDYTPIVSGGYLPLSAGSGVPLTGTLYGTTAIFSNLTNNYLPKHTAGGLINSLISDDGTKITINNVIKLTDNAYFFGSPTNGFRINSSDDAYNNLVVAENGNTMIRGITSIISTTASTSSTTGALVVAGGIGVGGNGYFGGSVTASNLSGTNTGDKAPKTQSFIEVATGSTGQVNTLDYTPQNTVGLVVSQNGSVLSASKYTISGATVQVTSPVYANDEITIIYSH